MNERVQKYIAEKKQEKKRELLLNEGLYERVVLGEEEQIDGNDPTIEEEWDYSAQTYVCYKKVPVEITDEEYEQLKAVCGQPEKADKKNNVVATVLTCIAWLIYIGGFIFGCIEGDEMGRYEFAFDMAFPYWLATLIFGTMLLGYAEIIKLLQGIKDK